VGDERLLERRARLLGDGERPGERGEDELGIAKGREWHPEDAVREGLGRFGRRLQGKSRLARPPGSGQGQQACTVGQESDHVCELGFSSQEGGGRHRQIRPVEALERRKLDTAELVDALGRGEVLQSMLAEVAQAVGAHEHGRRRRHEHLPTMPSGGDARCPVNVATDISLLRQERRPGVQADAHGDRAGGRASLNADAASIAPGAVGKAKKKASPWVSTSTPPPAVHAARIARRCSASASA
jgi:hypothetical protein